ncbi:hypothetical protein [Cryptosporangium minutisporangium]|uniref:Uncharacterized protein n=1 Tax=Cryptosporangium minutisporangium TaxID=113569 RepID=A0ABP6T0N4_9ACTN
MAEFTTTLARRWPTLLALPCALLIGADVGQDAISGIAATLLVLPLDYLLINQLGRRDASWWALGGLVVVIFVVELTGVVPLSTVLVALALILLVWGAVTGTPNGRATFNLQAAGMLGFGAIALAGMIVDPDLGRYLVAAGWLTHGVWDVVHLKLDRVVSRSYAEWCFVVDVAVCLLLLLI